MKIMFFFVWLANGHFSDKNEPKAKMAIKYRSKIFGTFSKAEPPEKNTQSSKPEDTQRILDKEKKLF